MSENNPNFADEYDWQGSWYLQEHKEQVDKDLEDPVGALAFTDFSKPMPVLEGEDAERFIRLMEENERKAKERAKQPPTLDELKKQLMYERMFYDMEKIQLLQREKDIRNLELKIKELENNNGETKEG